MAVNLQRKRVPCKKQDTNYNKNKTKMKAKKYKNKAREAPQERNLCRYPCEQRRCTFQSSDFECS
jgi:hypothetical protein